MPIQSVGFSKNTATGSTSLSLARPSGANQPGDLLIANLTQINTFAVSSSGWTLLSTFNVGTGYRTDLFYKFTGGSEPTSYTFAFANVVHSTGVLTAFRGVDASNPVDTILECPDDASDTTVVVGAITTSVAGAMEIVCYGHRANTAITRHAALVDWTLQTQNSFGLSSTTAWVEKAVAGSTGARNATAGASAISASFHLALRPGTVVVPASVQPFAESSAFGAFTAQPGVVRSAIQPIVEASAFGAFEARAIPVPPAPPTGLTVVRSVA